MLGVTYILNNGVCLSRTLLCERKKSSKKHLWFGNLLLSTAAIALLFIWAVESSHSPHYSFAIGALHELRAQLLASLEDCKPCLQPRSCSF